MPAASFFYSAWVLKFLAVRSLTGDGKTDFLIWNSLKLWILYLEQSLGPSGRLLHVLSIRNSNKAALDAKDRSAHLNIQIYLFYAACSGFPPSYASRKQNKVWNVIRWVDNPLWICGRCVSPSAYPCQPMLLAFAQDECREFRDLFKRGKLSCTRENDPVRDASGKQHSNKCIMCAEKLWVKGRSVGSLAPAVGKPLLPGAPWYSLSHLLLFQQKGEWAEVI